MAESRRPRAGGSRRGLARLLGLLAAVTPVLVGAALLQAHAATHTPARQGSSAAPARRVVAATSSLAVQAGTAPGTCLAYTPLRGDRHQTVYVDPGHGGVDSGTSGATSSGATVYEKGLTVATALDLLPLLRDDGYRVVMSRIDDRLLIPGNAADVAGGILTAAGEHDDIATRIACANAAHASALVAIHFDAFSDPTVGGTETIYDSVRPFSAASARLATLAQQDVLARLHAAGWAVPDRGVQDDSNVGTPAYSSEAVAYGHLLELGPAASGWLAHPSTMPGILIEPLFLSDPAEADVADSAQGQRAIARGLAAALTTFLAPSSTK
jgi:N-acetylmuramoyl-L-alanine amidase